MIICGDRSFADVANEVIQKLIDQGGKCLNTHGDCAYGDGEGGHCAVGWLFDPTNEALMSADASVSELLMYECVEEEINLEWVRDNIESLMSLQNLHDSGRLCDITELKRSGVDEKLMRSFVSIFRGEHL